ncbi:uncharacterized protein LOC135336874 isoform X3 [Halichondria panicea]|uniref:uncharacterized protein LOC135336874 isoform X3 n=1 Tax=Halichondria panicea TaxID=6063 RepID=UPI00312B44EE
MVQMCYINCTASLYKTPVLVMNDVYMYTVLEFQFSQEVISIAEEIGAVSVCLEIASNLPRNVEIRLVSQDGNATEPRDYTAVYTTVTFLSGTARDGPGSHMCLDIKLSDDSIVEMDEVFLLTAHSLAPNVNIINTATVIIVNSDVESGLYMQLYTSSVRGPTTDDGSVEVELQNGFRFLEQQYTYVISPLLVRYQSI